MNQAIQKLLKIAFPHKLELSGEKTSAGDWNSIDFKELLKVELNGRYAISSYAQIKRRNWKYTTSSALIVLGIGLSALSWLSFSILFFKRQRIGASAFEQDMTPLLTGPTLLFLSVPILTVFAGFRFRRKLNAEQFNPLHTNGQLLFSDSEMSERWQVYLDWVRQSKADIGVQQKDGVIIILTPELLEFDLTEAFILGEARHRDQLIGDASVNMSPLVMRERDWQNFEKHWTEHQDKKNKISPSKGKFADTKASSDFPVTKQHSRACPRFQYMLDNKDELFERYVALKIKNSELSIKRRPCHELLIFFSKNLNFLDIYFDSHKSRTNNSDKLKDFSTSVNAILEVDGNQNATRLSDLLKLEWRLLEKHIKSVGLISDTELTNASET